MGIVVQKFGGSSVADEAKLENVANIIIEKYDEGNSVVVVVSAQGKTTDSLLQKYMSINKEPNKREIDVLLSTGEQITISLLVMMLEKMGKKAISFTGWQIPIVTDDNYGNARIKSIDINLINHKLDDGYIVIVAGFQGTNEKGDITTLGRGGSDTTAVALASALNGVCEIFTDVDGVFKTDPKYITDVEKISKISYDEMLELASSGAKVLHNRCVEIAKNNNVEIFVKSSYIKNSEGTVVKNIEPDVNKIIVQGITKDDSIDMVEIYGVRNQVKTLYALTNELIKYDINIDGIIQDISNKKCMFTVKNDLSSKVINILKTNIESFDITGVTVKKNLSKVSIIGTGIMNNPNYLNQILKVLNDNNITIYAIISSELKISVIVDKKIAQELITKVYEKIII